MVLHDAMATNAQLIQQKDYLCFHQNNNCLEKASTAQYIPLTIGR